MPSSITQEQYGKAVLEYAQTGTYPEAEDVISAELPPSALPYISKLIGQSQEEVQVSCVCQMRP